MYPEDISQILMVELSLCLIVTLFWLERFVSARWHVDAEVMDFTIKYAQGVVGDGVKAGLLVFVGSSLWMCDLESLFGIIPALGLEFDWPHILGVGAGTLFVFIGLEAYRDTWSTGLLVSLLILIPVLSATSLAESLLWCLGVPLVSTGMLVSFQGLRLLSPKLPQPTQEWITNIFQRGAKFTPLPVVRDIAAKQISIGKEAPIYFGFDNYPDTIGPGNFLFVGSPGSGKTVLQRLMMQSTLPRIFAGSNERAVIFDAKVEMVSTLLGMALPGRIRILNPFDARCSVWDMAADFSTPADAMQLAAMFVPDDTDKDPFWKYTAKGVIADIIEAHIRAYRERRIPHWGIPDIIRALDSGETIAKALALHPSTQEALRNLKEERTFNNVISTIDLVRRKFRVLAALMDEPLNDPSRRFSLTDFMQGSGGEILVLAPSVTNEEVLNPFNQMILERISQLVLELPEIDQSKPDGRHRTWLFLDEFQRAGKVPRLESLMTNGRSKGLVTTLAFQDVDSVIAVYGEHLARVIIEGCHHKMLFTAHSPTSAEWAEKTIGYEEVIQLSKSTSVGGSSGPGGTTSTWSTGYSASEKTRPLVMKDEFRYIQKPGERVPIQEMPPRVQKMAPSSLIHRYYSLSLFSPFHAVCSVQGRVYVDEVSFTRVIEATLPKAGEDFVPREIATQYLKAPVDGSEAKHKVLPTNETIAALSNIVRPKVKSKP